MADRQVTAEWAYVGKAPATLAYDILATSGGDTDFGGYVGRYAAGSPDRPMSPDAPGVPPWVTFGPMVTPADETLISVAILDPAQGRDLSGRPVWPQRLFLIRYAHLAAIGASYQGLWKALGNVGLPAPDHQPLAIDVGYQPIEPVVATVERYGRDRMTALAAIILEDRIVMTDSTALPRGERVAVLDAALALLPYGFRAALSVSTAVNNTTSHKIDLVFAEFPNENIGQAIVQLPQLPDQAPIPVPRTKLGRAYQDMLRDKIENVGLPAVLEHLWAATSPCSLQHQDAAPQILGQLDFDGSLRRALQEGTATRAQVMSFFGRPPSLVDGSWRSPAMTAPMRQSALRLLFDSHDDTAVEVVLAFWPTLEDDLLANSSSGLDAGEPARAIWCLGVAARYSADYEDMFLARLLASGQAAPDRRRDRAQALVQVLDQLEPPHPGQLPLTWDLLCRGPDEAWTSELVRTFLVRQVQSGGRLDRTMTWASWLCLSGPGSAADVPAWAAALQLVCDPAVSPARCLPVSSNTISGDLVWAGVVLRLAAHVRRLPNTLPLLLDRLIQMADDAAASAARSGHPAALSPDMRFLLDSLDANLRAAGVPADAVAQADVVRVLLHGRLRGFPVTTDDERFLDGYLDGLEHGLRGLPPRSRSWVAQRILSAVVPTEARPPLSAGSICLLNTWSANRDLAPEVTDHVAAMDEACRPVDERLAPAYWENVALVPGLAGYASTPRLAAAIRTALSDTETLARWTGPNGVNNTPLAQSWYQARRSGIRVSEILRILETAGPKRIDPRQLDDVIREFQGLEHYDPDLKADSRNDLFACYEAVARGALGTPYATVFIREAIIRLQDEIRLRDELIRLLGDSPRIGRRRWFRLPWPSRRKPAADDPGRGESGTGEPRAGQPGPRESQVGQPSFREPAAPASAIGKPARPPLPRGWRA